MRPNLLNKLSVLHCRKVLFINCSFARKRMQQDIQVAQSAYSSGSISLFKWLSQLTQVTQSAYSSGSISLLKWLNQLTQVAQSASPAVCVTQFSHICNLTQPHQLVNGSTSFFHLIWVGNDYQRELSFFDDYQSQ